MKEKNSSATVAKAERTKYLCQVKAKALYTNNIQIDFRNSFLLNATHVEQATDCKTGTAVPECHQFSGELKGKLAKHCNYYKTLVCPNDRVCNMASVLLFLLIISATKYCTQ